MERPDEFEAKKRNYFSTFALRHLSKLRLHDEYGVLKKKDWRNVAEHCLLEGAVAEILGEKLDLPPEEKENLITGALLHDFFKRRQIQILKQSGGSKEAIVETDQEARQILKENGYSDDIIKITNAAADVKRMTEADVSQVERIMQYIDDITMDNEIHTVDERVDKIEENPLYADENESGRGVFGGLTLSQAQRKFGKEIQTEIANRLGIEDPETLPEWIKDELKRRY